MPKLHGFPYNGGPIQSLTLIISHHSVRISRLWVLFRTVMAVMIIQTLLSLLLIRILRGEEINENMNVLAELPLQELLAQKKTLGRKYQEVPTALPLKMSRSPIKSVSAYGIRRNPYRKTFHEEEESEDDKHYHVHDKKEKKEHDILNTSLTALSYLAFGGYLLCMIVNTLREKRRRFMMAYATGTGNSNMGNNPVTRRPIRIRFPVVQASQGRKKRRKRSDDFYLYEYYLPPQEENDFTIFNLN